MVSRDAYLPLLKAYIEEDPHKAARKLEATPEDRAAEVLSLLPSSVVSDVFRRLQPVHASRILSHVKPDLWHTFLELTDASRGSTIFLTLPAERRTPFLDALPTGIKEQIREILTFPENSAGRIMSTQFTAFNGEMKVKDAILKLRQIAKRDPAASYLYVIDTQGKLLGIMNMRDLLVASPETALKDVMRKEVFAVHAFMDREIVAQELSKRPYFSAPVIDPDQRLLGVIAARDLIEDVQEEATEDIQKMFGAGGDEGVFSPIGFKLKKRIPWLHVNLATAFLAGSVVALFEDIIARISMLAVFLPIIAGQGGNAGTQSLAVVLRGLVMREVSKERAAAMARKEIVIGVINGLLFGAITGLIAWVWRGNAYMGLVVALGMLVNLVVAGIAGAMIPLTMKSFGMDPAQSSGIVLTTITDVVGFFAFLGFAVMFQKYLV